MINPKWWFPIPQLGMVHATGYPGDGDAAAVLQINDHIDAFDFPRDLRPKTEKDVVMSSDQRRLKNG